MVIGGLAVIARGVRRMATPDDLLIPKALADAPELAEGFEAILARVGR